MAVMLQVFKLKRGTVWWDKGGDGQGQSKLRELLRSRHVDRLKQVNRPQQDPWLEGLLRTEKKMVWGW